VWLKCGERRNQGSYPGRDADGGRENIINEERRSREKSRQDAEVFRRHGVGSAPFRVSLIVCLYEKYTIARRMMMVQVIGTT
jgi:hypothetical protein